MGNGETAKLRLWQMFRETAKHVLSDYGPLIKATGGVFLIFAALFTVRPILHEQFNDYEGIDRFLDIGRFFVLVNLAICCHQALLSKASLTHPLSPDDQPHSRRSWWWGYAFVAGITGTIVAQIVSIFGVILNAPTSALIGAVLFGCITPIVLFFPITVAQPRVKFGRRLRLAMKLTRGHWPALFFAICFTKALFVALTHGADRLLAQADWYGFTGGAFFLIDFVEIAILATLISVAYRQLTGLGTPYRATPHET